MRTCGKCRRTLRHDESLQTEYLTEEISPGVYETGLYSCCQDCVDIAVGRIVSSPRTYPPEQPVPMAPRGGPLPVCGICRRSYFEDDIGQPIRIVYEDLIVAGELELEAGLYKACRDCVGFWRPIIAERRQMTASACVGKELM